MELPPSFRMDRIMNKVLRKRIGKGRARRGNRSFLLLACGLCFLAGLLSREAMPENVSVAGWSFPFMEDVEAKPNLSEENFDLDAVLDEAVVFEELQMRGEEGEESAYLLNAPQNRPYDGWAEQTHPNGQVKTAYRFEDGRVVMAKGWNAWGEPDGTKVVDGRGFVVESDDPEVGYHYEGGYRVAFRGLTDSGKPYHDYFGDGLCVSWHADGGKREEGHREDGFKEGVWRRWHPNGILSDRMEYLHGQLHGRWIEWHDNGRKKSEVHLKRGEPDGIWYEWYEDGLRSKTGLYKLGERTGFWEGWYDNGRKWFRKGYRSGKLSGTCQWWWRGGTLQDEAFFIGGIPCN
jgi:antitoxin component YwqK of YwqJK toxin-antitoxin module